MNNKSGGSTDLRLRLTTAAVLLALVLAALRWLPPPVLALVFGAFGALGLWEWTRLAGLSHPWQRAALVGAGAVAMLMLYHAGAGTSSFLFIFSMMWWVIAAVLVLRYQLRALAPPPGIGWRMLAGWAMILPAWAALVELRTRWGFQGVLALLLIIWAADSAAYLVGRKLGRRRLASRVSPGKSWEGVLAGMVGAAAVGWLCAPWLGLGERQSAFVLLVVLTTLISVLGDLAESLFKRVAGLKDSGSLLPGHGGVLDRIDSLLAAAPLFLFGCKMLEGAV